MARRICLDEFIRRCRERHGDTYDYSLVELKNVLHPVRIICPHHGVFEQLATNHMRGHGCARCAIEFPKPRPRRRMTTTNFIARARKLHGDRYDYSRVDVQGAMEPVEILCPLHGPFEQRPTNHLLGFGCPACGQEVRRVPVDAAEGAVREQYPHYRLEHATYAGQSAPATWRCIIHDRSFRRSGYELLAQYPTGCRDCTREARREKRRRDRDDLAARERLKQVSQGLDPRRVKAFRMHLDGHSLADIALAFGISKEGVRKWLQAVRRELDRQA